ncbi:MAG: DoxX family protein [Chitinophagales bacterium]|nr:DoxX family protein [Chitinophagales bacterium]
MKNRKTILLWILKLIAAVIMLQTLYFKFSAHPEAVYIFSKLGMEPYGRIAIGIMELIASVLVLIPRTSWFGALMAIGLMGGAIFFHLTKLKIIVYNDGGKLFAMALAVFICSSIILWMNRNKIPFLPGLLKYRFCLSPGNK